jgi:predicted NBD/HSP70 family sugar kinase
VNARQPGTPRLLRALNDRAALELLLEHGPLTRAQLGQYTGLSKVTASQLVERLEEKGLVVRVGEQSGGRGPNAQVYSVVPGVAYVVGVQVGPEETVAACADVMGTEVGRVSLSIKDSDDPVRVVHQAVVEATGRANAPLNLVRRVVLGTPGLVDPATGDLAFAFDLPRWHRGLLAALREDLQVPVVLENDVNLAAIAEAAGGAAKGVDDFVLVWIGRGVGLAVVLGGKLHRGASGAAGEIGYLPVAGATVSRDPSRKAKGGFQQIAGADAVRTMAREHNFRGVTPADAIRAAIAAGTAGGPVMDELARRLALGVTSVCVVLDPSLVVLAGDIGEAGGAALAQRIQGEVAAIAPVSPRVVVTGVTDDPVLRGALQTGLHAARAELFEATSQ